MAIDNVCILGGSGFVGRALVNQLVSRGKRVRVLTRRREQAKELILLPTVEVVEADVHDEHELVRQFGGMHAVINLVGILHEETHGRQDKPTARRGDFQLAHVELPRQVVHACGAAGVARLLHMSALGADPVSRSAYQRSKGIGEAIVREAALPHRDDPNWYLNGPKFIHGYGLAVTVFRPSVIFGRGDSFLNLFAGLVKLFPVLPLASAGARFQPVYVEDVARAFADSLENSATHGQTYDLCGPRIYTLEELVQMVAHNLGKRARIIRLGPWLSYLQAWAMEFKPGRPLMTRDNYYAMLTDNICRGGTPTAFDFQPAALEAVLPQFIDGSAGAARYDKFRSTR